MGARLLVHTATRRLVLLLLQLLIVGCGSDAPKGVPRDQSPPPPPARGVAARSEADAGVDASRRPEFQEQDFVETERNRDPFRSFAASFAAAAATTGGKRQDVMLDRYSIDELRLVGIVTGGAEHRAMLVDPSGKGWIIKRGQYIGREEIVHGKGASGAEYTLNWRVERIRDGDLVLSREDPTHPDVPPATRVIPLRPESTENPSGRP